MKRCLDDNGRRQCGVSSPYRQCDNKQMGIEVERKFLVSNSAWRAAASSAATIRQGYLVADGERTVRIRTRDKVAFITVKGVLVNMARAEYEYKIPLADANAMLNTLCLRPLIEKRRHIVLYVGMTWEVDEFFGENAPLVVAELERVDAAQITDMPSWIGQEVTGDPRYGNANLARRPYSKW